MSGCDGYQWRVRGGGIMKRDMEQIRKIVFAIEAHPHGYAPPKITIDGSTDEEVGYHLWLMLGAGLIHGTDVSYPEDGASPQADASGLTWEGLEFADAVRDESLWVRAKKLVFDKAGSVAYGVLMACVASLAKERLGIPK
jgi:hypothetical protein